MTPKSRKRSQLVMAGLVGFSALTLSACKEETSQAQVFNSEAECQAEAAKPGSWWTPEECVASYAQARDRFANNAPRYDALEVCEAEHGKGACQSDVHQTSSGGGSFMPMMLGYFMGQSMSGQNYQTARPLYQTSSGKYATADGSTRFNSLSGAAKLRNSAFKPAASTINKPPMTKATVKSTGGFGKVRTSTSSFRAGG